MIFVTGNFLRAHYLDHGPWITWRAAADSRVQLTVGGRGPDILLRNCTN